MAVEYREVAGFPHYRVGTDGSLWSRLRPGKQTIRGESKPLAEWKRLRNRDVVRGQYYNVSLQQGDWPRRTMIVSLGVVMLETFVGPRPPGHVVIYLDNSSKNCSLENLRWGTYSDIWSLRRRKFGEEANYHKLTEGQVREILANRTYGSGNMFVRKFGVSRQTIHLIRTRKIWAHLT